MIFLTAGFAYSFIPEISMTTTGSSPTTQASWPGGIAATSPGTLAFPDETRTTNNRIIIQFLTCELALTRGKHTTTQVLIKLPLQWPSQPRRCSLCPRCHAYAGRP